MVDAPVYHKNLARAMPFSAPVVIHHDWGMGVKSLFFGEGPPLAVTHCFSTRLNTVPWRDGPSFHLARRPCLIRCRLPLCGDLGTCNNILFLGAGPELGTSGASG